jgi:hypothetical protein
MTTANPAHRCAFCPAPAYHQTWCFTEQRYINTCAEHEPVAIPECETNQGEGI